MTTTFPVTVDSYSTKVDDVDDVLASHINNPQDAIVALENSLYHGLDNLFINGGFDVWQRTTNSTAVSTTRTYVADRWGFVTGASTLANVQRSTTVRTGARSKYSCELVGAASVTTVNISQRIESTMSGRYKRTLYFSGYIYNGSGASFVPKIYVSTPSAADDWTSSTVRNGAGSGESLQSCSDATWNLVSWTADVSGYTNINNGLEIRIEIPSGSMVAGDTNRLAEFMLATLVETLFVQPNFQQELAKCFRYFWIMPSGLGIRYQILTKVTTSALRIFLPLPIKMRSNPTFSGGSPAWVATTPSGNQVACFNWTAGGFLTITGALTVSLAFSSSEHIIIDFSAATSFSGTTGTVGELLQDAVTFTFSAEL